MQNMPIGIFRGDDTDAFSYQTIVGTINTDLDLTGCKAVFRYLGFSMEFDPIPEDRKLTIVIPADETKKFPPGLGYASLRVYDSDGRLKTFSNRIMVFVATKTPMFGSDEFEVDFNVRASLEPLKFFVGPNPDDFDEYRGYVEKVIDRASATKYGLTSLLDAIDSDLGSADGVAATPVAVKAAYAAIIEKLTDDYYTAEQTDEAIDRVAAYYITRDAAGNPFQTRAALLNAQTYYSGGEVRTPTRNDYAIVLADETHDNAEYRYIYAVPEGQTTGSWQPQYPVEGIMTVDQDVVRGSQNPVSGGGVWSMLWGSLQNIPEGLSSVYAWVLNRLGLKRDYTDLSYNTTETVEVPALHSVMTVGGQTLAEYDLLCTEEVPDPPQIGHTYTWRADGAAFYVTQGVSALQTTWILYSQNGESLDGVTTQNATQGFYPDLDFRPSGAVVTIHKTTAQKTVTVGDELALKSDIPAPSTATPAMDGTGAAGTSAAFARGDHVHPTDTSRMAASATGADIPVDATVGAQKINAALAGKASKADATLTPIYSDTPTYSEWTCKVDGRVVVPESITYDEAGAWTFDFGPEDAPIQIPGDEYSTELTKPIFGDSTFTATRTRTDILGYRLGPDEQTNPNRDKHLASEAEAEALRTGKQSALTAQQLANIAAVSDALAFDATHTYAAGDPVVYNGTLYTFTTAHTGAWTGTDVSAVDIIARLAGKLDKSGGTVNTLTVRFPITVGSAGNERTYGVNSISQGSNHIDFPSTTGTLALYADIPYDLVTKTINNGAVSLDDRAINAVAVSSSLASLTVNFPTATSGKARDFGLRLTVASGVTTAPEIAWPQGVICENADGEAPEIGADGAATILYFTETASGVFLVKGETLTAITQA